jgi:K+-transporting ATPase ATPase C chain
MNSNFIKSLRMTLVMIILCGGLFPLVIAGIGKLTKGGGEGRTLSVDGNIVGYENVGQRFVSDRYFWGRPSAVDYNAASSAGSNKGPSNPDYLALVQARIDTFLVHHPGVTKEAIPAEMVTASGSGLDPHISPASAHVQVNRIAQQRNLSQAQVSKLVEEHIEHPFLGFFGIEKINVLKLNIALDKL